MKDFIKSEKIGIVKISIRQFLWKSNPLFEMKLNTISYQNSWLKTKLDGCEQVS